MRIALASMPWSEHCRPSAALGSLAAFVAREESGWQVATRSEYVKVSAEIGFDLYGTFAGDCYILGELAYAVHLYPEQLEPIRAAFVKRATRVGGEVPAAHQELGITSWDQVFDFVRGVTGEHLDRAAAELAADFDIVGLTCCFGQLFANLALAARIKQHRAEVRIILGGSTVSDRVGPSILEHFSQVDFIIQGEGERPLLALLRLLDGEGAPDELPRGVLGRKDGAPPTTPAQLWEVERMDDLPFPDFDEYAELAIEFGLEWALPLEGSRGCWWDRTKKSGNPAATCYFCNLNIQWNGYREKSIERVLAEVRELSDRYANPIIYFLDNIIRHKGIEELGNGIAEMDRDFEIFYEMRANVRPHEILAMWEAGLASTQFGIEAFSSSLLKKMGKGTKVIQNLEVMKTCEELGVVNEANLITHFPGATEEEVAETCHMAQTVAAGFRPTTLSRFALGVGCTVDTLRERFGITNVRNKESIAAALPPQLMESLQLMELDFDHTTEGADWKPLDEVRAEWVKRHEASSEPLLSYRDGGSFLRVNDLRFDEQEIFTFHGLERELYLYCMEIRKVSEVVARFADQADEEEIRDHIVGFAEAGLMFVEDGRALSLAVATLPRIAAARIRAAQAEREASRPSRPAAAPTRPGSLPVLTTV